MDWSAILGRNDWPVTGATKVEQMLSDPRPKDFSERDDRLLERLLRATDDYTQDEILQAAVRLLIHGTKNPLIPGPTPRKAGVLIWEGAAHAGAVRQDRHFSREEALLLGLGYLQGVLQYDRSQEPPCQTESN